MKRFLGVLIASMFLASAAYAADDTTKDTKKVNGEVKGEKTKGEKVEKTKVEKRETTKGKDGEKKPTNQRSKI